MVSGKLSSSEILDFFPFQTLPKMQFTRVVLDGSLAGMGETANVAQRVTWFSKSASLTCCSRATVFTHQLMAQRSRVTRCHVSTVPFLSDLISRPVRVMQDDPAGINRTHKRACAAAHTGRAHRCCIIGGFRIDMQRVGARSVGTPNETFIRAPSYTPPHNLNASSSYMHDEEIKLKGQFH